MEIDITGVDMKELVKAAYDLSVPQGLGFLHFKPEPLTDEEATELLEERQSMPGVSLDYVKGRACKLTAMQTEDGKLMLRYPWYDHTHKQFQELLKRIGMEDKMPDQEEHGLACNCAACQEKRAEEKALEEEPTKEEVLIMASVIAKATLAAIAAAPVACRMPAISPADVFVHALNGVVDASEGMVKEGKSEEVHEIVEKVARYLKVWEETCEYFKPKEEEKTPEIHIFGMFDSGGRFDGDVS